MKNGIQKVEAKRKQIKHIDFASFSDQYCVVLGGVGQFAKTISNAIYEATGELLTDQQVYYRCKRMGIKLTDWRRGKGPYAEVLFSHFTVVSTQLNENKQVQKLFNMLTPPALPEGKKT